MRKIIVAFLLCLVANISSADEFKDKTEIKSFLKQLEVPIVKGDLKGAFEKIKPYWPIPTHEVDGIVYQLESQAALTSKRFGKALSIEFANSYKIADSFY